MASGSLLGSLIVVVCEGGTAPVVATEAMPRIEDLLKAGRLAAANRRRDVVRREAIVVEWTDDSVRWTFSRRI